MADRSYDWTPETDDTPPTAPRNRDELVQRNRAKGHEKSDTAPRNAEDDGGAQRAPSGVAPTPRTEPADTYVVKGAEDDTPESEPRDVRAGPGDAGAFDTPTHPPETYDRPRESSATRAFVVVGLALAIAVVAALFLMA